MTHTLPHLYRAIWDELVQGVHRSAHPFHVGCLATVSTRDEDPQAEVCMVVLREANMDSARLVAHTDVRSAKVDRIRKFPRVSWLCFDPKKQLQVRIRAFARVRTAGSLYEHSWDGSSLNSRRCYLCDPSPGTEADVPVSGLPPRLERGHPDQKESEQGRANFSVIEMSVYEMESLQLSSAGHRRALFSIGDTGLCRSTWLVP